MRIFAILVALLVTGPSLGITATAPEAVGRGGVLAQQSGTAGRCPSDCDDPRADPVRALAIRDLALYRALIAAYRDGHDDTVAMLRWWDPKRLISAVALIDSPVDDNRPWPVAFRRSAAMLETDAAIRCLDDKDQACAFLHLGIASDHIERGGPKLAVFASRWVLAVARHMMSHGGNVEQFLELGRSLCPSDPIVLYESGLLQELFATRSAWPAVDPLTGAAIREDAPIPGVLRDRAARLDDAERWLRQSVDAAPSTIMARLHLGRVEMMRRSNDEAVRLLRSVLDSTTDDAVAYLGLVFIGAVHERDDRLEEAAAAYQQAIDRFPRGQVAYVALSEVRQRQGRGDDSRALLRRVLTDKPDERREPWSWYFTEPAEIARERVEELRAEGRR